MKPLTDTDIQAFNKYCKQFNINIKNYSYGNLITNEPPFFVFQFSDEWLQCFNHYFSGPNAMGNLLQAAHDSAVNKMRLLTTATDPKAVIVMEKPYTIRFIGSIYFANEFIDRLVELKKSFEIDLIQI